MPSQRIVLTSWNIATLFYASAVMTAGALARSRAKRSMLQRVLALSTAIVLQETRGQHYDVQQLDGMHDGWIFRSSHIAGSPAGGGAIGIRSGVAQFLRVASTCRAASCFGWLMSQGPR